MSVTGSMNKIDTAMVLAAGRGTRLAPLTNIRPKPLVDIGGTTPLDRALDKLAAAGIVRATVNSHHLGDQIAAHLAGRAAPAITLSPEADLLETGGGVALALPTLGDGPFLVVNADVLWDDGYVPALTRLMAEWRDATMDALLLLHPTVRAMGYDGLGDFMCDPAGRLSRRPQSGVAPFLFTGLQVLHPRLFAGAPRGAFSLNRLYDRAIEADRLWGIVHDGDWIDIGTPDRLEAARRHFGDNRQGLLL